MDGILDNLNSIIARIRDSTLVFSIKFADDVELACSEAVTNIIEHAYREKKGLIRVVLNLYESGIQLDFFDQGEPFDVSTIPDPELDEIRDSGYGISIIRQTMDEYTYEPATPKGNHLHLVKKIGG